MFHPPVQHNNKNNNFNNHNENVIDPNVITSKSNDLNRCKNISFDRYTRLKDHNQIKLSHFNAKNKSINSENEILNRFQVNKLTGRSLLNRTIFMISLITFAFLNDVIICKVNGADVSGVVQIDENNDKEHLTDSFHGITPNPIKSGGFYNEKIGNLEKIDSLEMSLAAVFNKVAYGTTTKRSIADTGFVPNPTTIPTPQLTTYR